MAARVYRRERDRVMRSVWRRDDDGVDVGLADESERIGLTYA